MPESVQLALIASIVPGVLLVLTQVVTAYLVRKEKREVAEAQRLERAEAKAAAEAARLAAEAAKDASERAAVQQRDEMLEQKEVLLHVETLVNSKSTQQLRHIAQLTRVIANQNPTDEGAQAAARKAEADLASDEAAQEMAAMTKLLRTSGTHRVPDAPF